MDFIFDNAGVLQTVQKCCTYNETFLNLGLTQIIVVVKHLILGVRP